MKSYEYTPTLKFVKLNACDKDMIPLIALYSQARLCPTNLSRLATPLNEAPIALKMSQNIAKTMAYIMNKSGSDFQQGGWLPV